MAIKVVSDLHGATDQLANQIDAGDILLLLGDLLNFVDYESMDGLLVDLFGVEAVKEIVDLRTQSRFEEARSAVAKHRQGREEEVAQRFDELIRQAYESILPALPDPTYLIHGNVDSASAIEQMTTGGGVRFVDGEVIELGGLRFGFAGGGLPTPFGYRGREVAEEAFNEKLDRLGPVDVLCTHIPPALPSLTFDTRVKRSEKGSEKMIEYIRAHRPRSVLFGHIHQPLVSSTHLGPTHLLNCGYFRRTGRAITLVP